MAGLVPPVGPKPLRRGEGPAIQVLAANKKDMDARDICAKTRFALQAGHDETSNA
jgi:hypothetical protein